MELCTEPASDTRMMWLKPASSLLDEILEPFDLTAHGLDLIEALHHKHATQRADQLEKWPLFAEMLRASLRGDAEGPPTPPVYVNARDGALL
jgi:hypothetical protein